MGSMVRYFDRPGDRTEWDELVAAAPTGHVLQSWAWGELKGRFGWQAQRLAVGPVAAQVLYRRLPGGLGTIGYVPKGPMADLQQQGEMRAWLQILGPLARKRRAICLKIEPDLEDNPALAQQLDALGFRPSPQGIQPRRTVLVDLEDVPDQLLARMKQKTRYNIRLAGRKGVVIRSGDEGDLLAFYQLMEMTASRDGFGIHSQTYYEAAHRLFVPPQRGCLLLAEYEGRLLAGLMAMGLGQTACYMYGASSDEDRNLMPTYLLQWEAMLWARKQGYRRYDLWGVPDEDEAKLEAQFTDRNDGLWGVYRFKRGFGGRLVRTVGAWDLVYAPLRYRLYTLAAAWLNRGQVS
jgi:peptidoglycan pentaglycine glycine transferase (the first glycine)